ncbi:MAG TPA: carbamoyltransferase [Planctomycetaceae bacterium]|nr:carbamoyltransferase [Planctomycetaceae bacterium]
MTAILGLSAFYHDSAAALVVDGRIVAAAQEERFSRKKNDASFPKHAVEFCLEQASLKLSDLDYVSFYEKPLLHFDRLLESWLAFAPRGFRAFRQALPLWLKQKLRMSTQLRNGLGEGYSRRFIFTEHHESHAASAFFPSPFNEAAILTMDGVGEWTTTSIGVGRGNQISLLEEIRFPHSLGLLYSAFTYYLGFRVNSGEYKVMGLAPYGRPIYRDLILKHLIQVHDDGSFFMDMSYFNYCAGLTMTSPKFHALFDGPPRSPESPLTQREMDLAASLQSVTEDVMLKLAARVHQKTGLKNLVLAGGVALNCVGNGKILREGPFEKLWIQPAAGDAGGALGTALFVWHQLLNKPRTTEAADSQKGSLLGPQFSDDAIEQILRARGTAYQKMSSHAELCDSVAARLLKQHVVGWFQGRMEFGPRALGSRSILGDPRNPEMQTRMNLKIKFRESFRPFAPIVLQDHAHEYFDLPEGVESPYMLLVTTVAESQRLASPSSEETLRGIDRLKSTRSTIPAVTHVDLSARVQTVDEGRFPLLHQLLTAFHEKSGCPVLINTSFNVRGEPVVCTPENALNGFLNTGMDTLAIGSFLLDKNSQPLHLLGRETRQFGLD